MSSTGNVFAGTGENNAGIGATAWTNPGNITATDANDATCNAGASSNYLVARNFGFTIPAGSSINGVTVRINASESSAGTEVFNAQLQDSSAALIGSSKSVTLNGATKAVYTYGSTSDIWGTGTSLTPTVVNNANFGVRFWFTTGHNVQIDYVTVAIEYTTGGATLTGSASTTAQGTAAPGSSAASVGQAITAAQQTIPALSEAVPLVGSAVTVGQGNLRRGGGQVFYASQGSVVGGQPLVGQASTVGQGAVTPDSGTSVTEVVFGQESAVGQGTITQGNAQVPLRSKKAVVSSASYALVGSSSSVVPGVLLGNPQITPSGQVVTMAQGQHGKQRAHLLTGSAITATAGTMIGSGGGTSFLWQINDGDPIFLASPTSGTVSSTLATGANGQVAQVSPALLPGQALSIDASGVLKITEDSTTPQTDITRDWYVTVMDSPYATAVRLRDGTLWGPSQSGTFAHIRNALDPNFGFLAGDIIEISPGAVATDATDYGSYGENNYLAIFGTVTIRNMAGQGWWRILPPGVQAGADVAAIIVHNIANTGGVRSDVTIQGFDIDTYGYASMCLRVRGPTSAPASWNDVQRSLTLQNFRLGNAYPPTGGQSGINGMVEFMTFENGFIYDCGGGVNSSGDDHNFYVAPKQLICRGIHSYRSRGPVTNPGEATKPMDGHIFKNRSRNSTFEGCVLDGGLLADNSRVLQFANGGTHTVTGCVIIQCPNPNNAGSIAYEWENSGADFSDPTAVNPGRVDSLTIRNNVFVSRAGANNPHIFVRPITAGGANALNPTLDIRDNIGVHATDASSLWVTQPAGPFTWTTNNSALTYTSTDAWAINPRIYDYRVLAGAITGGASITTQRFGYPAQYSARTDSFRGVG